MLNIDKPQYFRKGLKEHKGKHELKIQVHDLCNLDELIAKFKDSIIATSNYQYPHTSFCMTNLTLVKPRKFKT